MPEEPDGKRACLCIGCGSSLNNNEKMLNYCEECFLGMNLRLNLENKESLFEDMEQILKYFVSDVTGAFKKDPAAKSIVEVLTSYPGIQAVLLYRIAHLLWKTGLPFVPRYLSSIAHQLTGIDIHPGATIGKEFFIDHGQGVVIGETAEIGNNVTLYQGVTLGGVSLENKKRHPTLGNHIVVGAGAKILGPILIGDNVKIGANSVVIKDVPPNSVVVGNPGRIVSKNALSIKNAETIDFAHGNLPDPVANLIQKLEDRLSKLEKSVNPSENEYLDFSI
jgi:serine O-acetyltransferase